MELIDTHVHLTWPSYESRVEEIVERAVESGVTRLIDIGNNLVSSREARKHAHQFESVWFTAGVHPNDAGEAEERDIEAVEELLRDPKCVGVGETGLDNYRDHSSPDIQERWLRMQLELAKRVGKPVVLHDRNASERLVEVLKEQEYDGISGPGGVFHCFAGDTAMAEEVLALGFHISFTGNLTFKRSDRPEIARSVPLERLLLETDSPFLAPVPLRGRENEPAFVHHIAAEIGRIKGVEINEVAKITSANAIRLFGLD